MSDLPALTGREVIGALAKLGFSVLRVKGSHHFLRHAVGRCTTIPVHGGETIGRGLLAQILRDREVSRQQLRDVL